MLDLNHYQLWQLINNPTLLDLAQHQAAELEYQRRFVMYQPLARGLEYPTEVIYELALWSGHDLPVPFKCDSAHHVVRRSHTVYYLTKQWQVLNTCGVPSVLLKNITTTVTISVTQSNH